MIATRAVRTLPGQSCSTNMWCAAFPPPDRPVFRIDDATDMNEAAFP
jgi:hypothetical protein